MKLFANNPVIKKDGVPLSWAIFAVILLSIGLVAVSFGIFLYSGAYDTVKQIEAASTAVKDDSIKDLDVKSPVQAVDLRDYSDAIKQRIMLLNDTEDFNISGLDAGTIGF